MTGDATREVVRRYYNAWAEQDRSGVRILLADDLDFRSPQDKFASADQFLDACWKYSDGLAGVSFIKEVYTQDQAFVVLDWESDDGSHFADAEYVRVEHGKICEILVVNNFPEFSQLVG